MDAASGEHLIGATILDQKSKNGTISNSYGFFSLTLPKGAHNIQSSFVGYRPSVISIQLSADTTFNLILYPQVMDEVVITSEADDPIIETTEMGTFNLNAKQLANRPAVLGESDVMKVLQLYPGVQSGHEGSSGLYVRGGGPDQNLILLDGVPVYNSSHLFGFLSTFNSDAIKDVKLVKGGFPARYGGRLSSVVDISLKEGDAKGIHGTGALSFVASRFTLEGPIKNESTSFIISARRTFLDLALKPFMQPKNYEEIGYDSENNPVTSQVYDHNTASLYFYDFSAKINHKFSTRDRLFTSFYFAKDNGTSVGDKSVTREDFYSQQNQFAKIHWNSGVGLIRWNHVWSHKLFSNTSLSYSTYHFQTLKNDYVQIIEANEEESETFSSYDTQSDIKDWSVRIDFDFIPNPNHYIRFGVQAIDHAFSPNVIAVQETIDDPLIYHNHNIDSKEYSVYIEDDISFAPKIKTNIGIHASAFVVGQTTYSSIQPRISSNFLFNPSMSLKASYSHMTQFLHLLVHPSVGLPTDFWVPATEKVRPQESDQFSLGWYYTKPANDLEVSVEAYYKMMSNLIEYEQGASFLNHRIDWQDKITMGSGRSYGAEFFILKTINKTNGWVGYTISRSDRQFDELNFGQNFPYKYDRRHDVSLAVNHQINEKIFLSANWVFSTGNAITLPEATYFSEVEPQIIQDNGNSGRYFYYSGKNDYRMRSYHRLDLSARFYKKTKWGERNWIVSVYNAYNRLNPFYVEVQQTSEGTFQLTEHVLFPIIPSLSYQFNF